MSFFQNIKDIECHKLQIERERLEAKEKSLRNEMYLIQDEIQTIKNEQSKRFRELIEGKRNDRP